MPETPDNQAHRQPGEAGPAAVPAGKPQDLQYRGLLDGFWAEHFSQPLEEEAWFNEFGELIEPAAEPSEGFAPETTPQAPAPARTPKVLTEDMLAPDRLSEDWGTRVAERLAASGKPEALVREVADLTRFFSRTAADLLIKDPEVPLPHARVSLSLEQRFVVLDLFIRAIHRMGDRLRDYTGPNAPSAADRRQILIDASWELFNMAKLMVALQKAPADPTLEAYLRSAQDMQVLMSRGAEELLKKHSPRLKWDSPRNAIARKGMPWR